MNYKKAKTSTDSDGNETTTYLDTSYVLSIGFAGGEYYVMPSGSSITYRLPAEKAVELLSYLGYVPEETEM